MDTYEEHPFLYSLGNSEHEAQKNLSASISVHQWLKIFLERPGGMLHKMERNEQKGGFYRGWDLRCRVAA